MDKRFAVTGVGGYIAPRHLQAIRDTGNILVAACDPFDSVGILDRYFMDARFFKEFERFDRHLDKLRRQGSGIDYLSICSPNYLHDAHIRLALRVSADAICEKPLVLSPWNLDALADFERETGRRVHTILQLRLHPAIEDLRQRMKTTKSRASIDLTYITSRGRWYAISWKGDESRSGGVVTNIGIHFFDMLMWIFGPLRRSEVHLYENNRAGGFLELEQADVRWYLSLERADLPATATDAGMTTYRSLAIDKTDFEFSTGFTDLHTSMYKRILAGSGFGISDARPSIELVHGIRSEPIKAPAGDRAHPYL